ncbi:MAG: hypothetical protein JNM94_13375 [Phycisphaerae bacterium]|nr:hypothetical protein [Phycisphaerae bacterium]
MGLLGAVVGGAIGGAVGAVAWAAIAYFTHFELGIIAWGIGILVGVGVRIGGSAEAGIANGILAVCIAISAIAAGKYVAISFLVSDVEKELQADLEAEISKQHNADGMWVLYVADQLIAERESKGEKVDWPGGHEPDSRINESYYPPDVIQDAKARWAHMSPQDQETYKLALEAKLRQEYTKEMRVESKAAHVEGFAKSWGLLDIVFVVLAVASAFKLATGTESDD